jgi:hypothetical protein
MDGGDGLDGLDLQDKSIRDHKIQPLVTEQLPAIDDGVGLLTLEGNGCRSQLEGDGTGIDMLEKDRDPTPCERVCIGRSCFRPMLPVLLLADLEC